MDVFAGLDPLMASGLFAASFAGSFITVTFGLGGGVLVLALMASVLPTAALIPVHGVVQLGSKLFRRILNGVLIALALRLIWKGSQLLIA